MYLNEGTQIQEIFAPETPGTVRRSFKRCGALYLERAVHQNSAIGIWRIDQYRVRPHRRIQV